MLIADVPGLVRTSEVGTMLPGLHGTDDVRRGFCSLRERFGDRLAAVVVQPMTTSGVEVTISVLQEQLFPGNLAALIAYSALVAIFPLLLLLVTVLDIVLKNNQELQEKVVNAALERYPVIGPALEGQIGHLSQAGIALAVAVIGIFIGSLGVANSVQNALNSVWEIPFDRRPGFPWSWLRSGALIVVVGTGFIATTFLSGLAADAVHFLSGEGQKVLTYAVSLVLNFGVLWLASRLGAAKQQRRVEGSGSTNCSFTPARCQELRHRR